jgi:putative ABC transport system substrate-binding protein
VRRDVCLVVALIAAIASMCGAAMAQPAGRQTRVGIIVTTPALKDAFMEGLRDSGYVEGQNLVVVHRPLGDSAISEVLRQNVDVICATSQPMVRAAKQATTTIPVVGVDLESDPVASGLVKSLARPGGNVTGFFLDLPELGGKLIQLLRESVPGLGQLAVVWHADVGKTQFGATEQAARRAGLGLVSLPVRSVEDLRRAFETARLKHVGGVVVLSAPIMLHERALIADLGSRYRLPTIGLFTAFPEAGGLLSYGPNFPDIMRRAAGQVARVLRGAQPAELPVERPSKFELVVNLRTARTLGVTVPPSVLLRADRVIE